jgi:hypothetical protein
VLYVWFSLHLKLLLANNGHKSSAGGLIAADAATSLPLHSWRNFLYAFAP